MDYFLVGAVCGAAVLGVGVYVVNVLIPGIIEGENHRRHHRTLVKGCKWCGQDAATLQRKWTKDVMDTIRSGGIVPIREASPPPSK